MTTPERLQRTKLFALRNIRAVQALPRDGVGDVLGKQLLRSATSVGANYRAACRAKSGADFLNKLKIVEEECDESIYWRELLIESNSLPSARLEPLVREANEIPAMIVAAIKTTRAGFGRRSIPAFPPSRRSAYPSSLVNRPS
jgi:four helix bundle protein